VTHEELLDQAKLILRDDTELIEPARLAELDQVAALARDDGDDGFEILAEALDDLERCDTLDEELLVADVAYVGALLIGSA
jgi:hypothetical protein